MSKNIDLTKYSEEELIRLNRRIVDRLRFLQQTQCFQDMAKFSLGETISFTPREGWTVVGTVARLNKKTVTVVTRDGERWNVAPALLSRTTELSSEAAPEVVTVERDGLVQLHTYNKRGK